MAFFYHSLHSLNLFNLTIISPYCFRIIRPIWKSPIVQFNTITIFFNKPFYPIRQFFRFARTYINNSINFILFNYGGNLFTKLIIINKIKLVLSQCKWKFFFPSLSACTILEKTEEPYSDVPTI